MKNKINHASLVAVVDIKTLKLYKTKGGKIINKIAHYTIDLASHKIDKHIGFYRKKNLQSSFFDPHTPEKGVNVKCGVWHD